MNRINSRVVADLKWLESLAPRPPEVPDAYLGKRIPLHMIQENTEYPYWSAASGSLVIAAQGLSMQGHAVRAITALRNFLRALALSDPAAFTSDIRDFLREHPFSTAIADREV
jgi:hypothetical protein